MRRYVLLAGLVPVWLVQGCGPKPKPPPPPPPQVGYVTVTAQPVTLTTELAGRTAPSLIADVRPQVDGLILRRLFQEGGEVRKGQALYQIDPRPYQAALEQARGALANARAAAVAADAQAARFRTLIGTQAVAAQQIDNAIAQAAQARAAVAQDEGAVRAAAVNLAFTVVRAPISGRIGRSLVTAGALVGANQTTALATVTALDPIFVDLTQSSDAVYALRQALAKGSARPARATVSLETTDGSRYPDAGVLEFTEALVNESANTVTVRARFPNPHGWLLPGMFVRVEAPQEVDPHGVLAPQQGVTRDPKGGGTVLVVGPGDKLAQKTVQLGQAVGNTWLVTSGLSSGDKVVVEGVNQAKAGQKVRPYPVTLPPMPAAN